MAKQAKQFGSEGGATWRTRWFWRWHAWRLRHARAQENGCGVTIFDGFAALEQHGYTDVLFDLHHQLTERMPDIAPQDAAFFRERLMRELDGTACTTLFAARDGSIGGFCWASVDTLAGVLKHYRRIPALADVGDDDWETIEQRIGAGLRGAAVLALNGIGLGVPYRRGIAPLKQLLKPLLELALRHGATRALWWAPCGSPLCGLSAGFGATRVFATPTCVFFMLADVRPLARIFAALPASGIADLFGRVAPPRPPKPVLAALPPIREPVEAEKHAAA